jgi:hypothetical protein
MALESGHDHVTRLTRGMTRSALISVVTGGAGGDAQAVDAAVPIIDRGLMPRM